jgi:tRNA dimethylallyltransferase
MTSDGKLLVIICGPTASGKTAVAIQLAKSLETEIISADSRQFYEQMKIGTAFPSEAERGGIPHHFLGHLSITDPYNVSLYEKEVIDLLDMLFRRYPAVVMAGGSGLYIHAVCHGIDTLPDSDPLLRDELKRLLAVKGIQTLQEKLLELDPVYSQTVDLYNAARLIRALEICITTGLPFSSLRKQKPIPRSFNILKIGLEVPREELYKKINERVEQMLENGWMAEARSLFGFRACNALNTLGYKELFAHLEGKTNYRETVEKIKTNTRRYAKRQMTWFRKDSDINWFSPGEIRPMLRLIRQELQVKKHETGVNLPGGL